MRKSLLPAAGLMLAWAIVASFTGGIETRVFGVWVRARGAFRPLTICAVLLLLHVFTHRDQFARVCGRIAVATRRRAQAIALLMAILLAAYGVRFGAFVAGGSDPYGYVSEAYGWARGELPKAIALPLTLPFPSSDLIQTPLGYRLGTAPHTMVPTYPPGLPWLMALALLAGGACGPFLITPLSGGLLVWSTFVLGRRAAGPIAGLVAAVIVGVAPVVLFQVLWPMSDVPAGAVWTSALAAGLASHSSSKPRRWALVSGLCTAVGLAIRPNVAPLAFVPLFVVAAASRGRERWASMGLFVLPVIPVPIAIGALNAAWYGSPVASGYGNAGELYAFANVWTNLKLYVTWFWQSESPSALIGLLALTPVAWSHSDRRVLAACLSMIALTLGCYLPYAPFEAWWYLRFLLPAAGAAATLIAIGIMTLGRAIQPPFGPLAASIVFCTLPAFCISFARSTSVFGDLRASEERYAHIGEFVARTLPGNAAIFAGQHSGSLRFYGGRVTLRYDFMDRDWASRAPAVVEGVGLHPYLMLDDFEVPQFRTRFALPPESALPWPVVTRMRELGGLTLWDLSTTPGDAAPVVLEPRQVPRCAAPLLTLRVR